MWKWFLHCSYTWKIKFSCISQSFREKIFRWSNFLALKLPEMVFLVKGPKLCDRELAMSVFGDKMVQNASPSDLSSKLTAIDN